MSRNRLPSQFDLAKRAMKALGISRTNPLMYLSCDASQSLRFVWFVSLFASLFGLSLAMANILEQPLSAWLLAVANLFLWQLPIIVVSGWVWAYVQWRKKYNEFVAKYSDVLEYKIRIIELERDRVRVDFAERLGEVEDLKHELFHSLSVHVDQLLALDRLTDLDDDVVRFMPK